LGLHGFAQQKWDISLISQYWQLQSMLIASSGLPNPWVVEIKEPSFVSNYLLWEAGPPTKQDLVNPRLVMLSDQ